MALPNNNILPGSAPLLWSSVKDAFDQINENFISLDLASGGDAVNLENLYSSVSPATDNQYTLGTNGTNKWKSLFIAGWQDTESDRSNGIFLGSAQIKGISSSIELPANSTVLGTPIKEAFFNSIQVDNELRLETSATSAPYGETINLNSGDGMQLVVSSGADSITFNNTGVLQVTGTANQIGVSGTNSNLTLTNLGVLSLTNTGSIGVRTPGLGISVSSATGNTQITNTGVIQVLPGLGINASTNATTGIVEISNAYPAPGNAFRYVSINGEAAAISVEANSTAAVFNIESGLGITLTKNTGTDTVNVAVNPAFDLTGSIFSQSAVKLVDSATGEFFGQLTGSVIGNASTATLAATATTVRLVETNSTNATHYLTFVDTATGDKSVKTDLALSYNPGTNTLTGGLFVGNVNGIVTGNIFTNLIDSADSSAITVTPAVLFSSDITVENELRVNGGIIGYISLAQLKTVVAASTDFADFQTKIAAL